MITTPAISERFESYSETSDNDEYLFAVKKLFVEQDKKLLKFEVNVNLEQSKVKVLIDSGAAVNIMNYKTFGEINRRLEKKINIEENKHPSYYLWCPVHYIVHKRCCKSANRSRK